MMAANQMEKSQYRKLKLKVQIIKEDLKFLKKCDQENIIPDFIENSVKCSIKNNRTTILLRRMKKMYLKLEKSHFYSILEAIEPKLYSLHLKLTRDLSEDEWKIFDTHTETVISAKIDNKVKTLKRKFDKLVQQNPINRQPEPVHLDEFVINKSSVVFDEEELKLLNKGLNFTIAPKLPPIMDIVASVESGIQYLQDDIKNDVRTNFERIISREKTINKAINNTNHQTIALLADKDCFFTKADKGNAVVIMDKNKYDENMHKLIQDGPYILMTTNPLNKMITSARNTVKEIIDTMNLSPYTTYKLKVSNPHVPLLYGLPKIHKEGDKMRPITSYVDSPWLNISRWLLNELKSIQPLEGLAIKNSIDFIEKVKDITVADDEILVSFDVVSLFPSIPIDEALQNMNDWLVQRRIDHQRISCYI
jgi:hypothetical protein